VLVRVALADSGASRAQIERISNSEIYRARARARQVFPLFAVHERADIATRVTSRYIARRTVPSARADGRVQ